jgi:hypothetical protein
MPSPTDRGYAEISYNQDGTVNVKVATAIEYGRAKGVYAQHIEAPFVRVAPGVHLAGSGQVRYTTQVVEVSKGGGGVLVRAGRSVRGA